MSRKNKAKSPTENLLVSGVVEYGDKPCPQAGVCPRRIIVKGARVVCAGKFAKNGKKPCELGAAVDVAEGTPEA